MTQTSAQENRGMVSKGARFVRTDGFRLCSDLRKTHKGRVNRAQF